MYDDNDAASSDLMISNVEQVATEFCFRDSSMKKNCHI